MRIAIALAVVATGFAGGFLAAPEEPPATAAAAHTRPIRVQRPAQAIPALGSGVRVELAAEQPKPKPEPKPRPGSAREERLEASPSPDALPPTEAAPASPDAPPAVRPPSTRPAPKPAAPKPPAPRAPAPGAPAPPPAPVPTQAPPTDPGESYDTSGGDY